MFSHYSGAVSVIDRELVEGGSVGIPLVVVVLIVNEANPNNINKTKLNFNPTETSVCVVCVGSARVYSTDFRGICFLTCPSPSPTHN